MDTAQPYPGHLPGRILLLVVAVCLLCACDDGSQRQGGPPPAPAGGTAPGAPGSSAPEPTTITHLGIGAHVIASSTQLGEPDEGPPEAMLDGDLTTRWSSAAADDQEVFIDLGSAKQIGSLRLYWAKAAAKCYLIQISLDGSRWSVPITTDNGGPGPRVDVVPLHALARYLKIGLKQRATPAGFSLYEVAINPP